MVTVIGYIGNKNDSAYNALIQYMKKHKELSNCKVKSYKNIEQLILGLKEGKIEKAILKFGDSVQGRVEKNYDLIFKNELYVNGEIQVEDRENKKIYNHYYLISQDPAVPPEKQGKQYHTLVAITPQNDRSGLLRDISSVVSIYKVNMTDIFSRPAINNEQGSADAKMFYIIMEGHIMSDTFQTHILEGLKSILEHSEEQHSFRFLGCFIADN